MQLIINNEPYTTDTPPFDRARWVRHGSRCNLELLQDGEVALTFHDIAEQDKGNYQLEGGEIEEYANDLDRLTAFYAGLIEGYEGGG